MPDLQSQRATATACVSQSTWLFIDALAVDRTDVATLRRLYCGIARSFEEFEELEEFEEFS